MIFRRAFFCCFGLVVLAAEAQEGGEQNLVEKSDLPSGAGFAAKGIAGHEAVIFAEDFESGEFKKRWDEVRDDGGVLSLVDESEKSSLVGKRSLRVKATLGKNTGGGMTKWFSSSETLFIRFYTKFDPKCDYVHHFCTLRANKGLKGKERWSGFGGAGLQPEGDERFSTALEPWGNWGRWAAPGQWNFYSYWHEMKASPDGKFWGNGFRPKTGDAIRRTPGSVASSCWCTTLRVSAMASRRSGSTGS